jgi:hypothetical protein
MNWPAYKTISSIFSYHITISLYGNFIPLAASGALQSRFFFKDPRSAAVFPPPVSPVRRQEKPPEETEKMKPGNAFIAWRGRRRNAVLPEAVVLTVCRGEKIFPATQVVDIIRKIPRGNTHTRARENHHFFINIFLNHGYAPSR